MKSATGYIFFDEKKKRWIARFSPVNKVTGKQKEFKRLCLTKTEARKKLDELRQKYEKSGGGSILAQPAGRAKSKTCVNMTSGMHLFRDQSWPAFPQQLL